jgi:hypothetical protein
MPNIGVLDCQLPVVGEETPKRHHARNLHAKTSGASRQTSPELNNLARQQGQWQSRKIAIVFLRWPSFFMGLCA